MPLARKEVAWHMLYPHLATRGDGNKLHSQSSQLLNLLGDTDELEEVTLVSPRPTAKQHHVICGNRLFGGEWLEGHKRRIYCIRKIIEFCDNVTLPSTQLGIGGKGKIRAN